MLLYLFYGRRRNYIAFQVSSLPISYSKINFHFIIIIIFIKFIIVVVVFVVIVIVSHHYCCYCYVIIVVVVVVFIIFIIIFIIIMIIKTLILCYTFKMRIIQEATVLKFTDDDTEY